MDDMACARADLAELQRVADVMRKGVENAVANLRDHLNRLEDASAPVSTMARRRQPRGESITADPVSVFLARVEAGDPTANALKDILDRVGLKVGEDGKVDGNVRCFTTLEAIHLRNASLVERTLRVIVDAWEGALVSLRADMVAGVAAFLAEAPEVDDRELSRRLRDVSAKDVLDATAGDRRKNLPAYLADVYTR